MFKNAIESYTRRNCTNSGLWEIYNSRPISAAIGITMAHQGLALPETQIFIKVARKRISLTVQWATSAVSANLSVWQYNEPHLPSLLTYQFDSTMSHICRLC
jgi:hypothetical protein